MQLTTKQSGWIIIPFGVNIMQFLKNNALDILWTDEDLQKSLDTLRFQGDPDNDPQIIQVFVEIPIPMDEAEQRVEPLPLVRRLGRHNIPIDEALRAQIAQPVAEVNQF